MLSISKPSVSVNARNRAVDIARGIAMYSIVLGHLGNSTINRFVFTYHLPIFYLISGYFFHYPQETDKIFLRKKARSFLFPYYITCLVICLLAIPLAMISGEDWKLTLWHNILASFYGAGDNWTEPFPVYSIGAIWFLWAEFWGEFFLKKALEMKRGNRIVFIVLVFALSTWSYKTIWLPLSIQAGGCALLFMYIGYIVHDSKNVIVSIKKEYKVFAVIIAFLAWIWMIQHFTAFWLVHCQIGNGIMDIIGSLSGCLIIYLISCFLNSKRGLPAFLAFTGRCSLLFLCIHIVELKLMPYRHIYGWLTQYIAPSDNRYLAFVIIFKIVLITGALIILYRIPTIRILFGYEKRSKDYDRA